MSDGEAEPSYDDFDVGAWLQPNGPDAEIAICTRVRFARNVKGFRFSTCMTSEESEELARYLQRQLTREDFAEQLDVVDVGDLGDLERRLLLERHLISRELASADRKRFVAINKPESVSVMVNEEDHIRAQVFEAGQSIDSAFARADALDQALTKRVPLAYSDEFGFLTSCPTNTGTGLRISVMLHLPGLVWAEEMDKATRSVQKINMAVRGLYGEGSRATGDYYQVSNQITLGRAEAEIVADVRRAVERLIAAEREVRAALLKGDKRNRTLDRIFRNLGTLERARILTTEEALSCLSALRFGVEQGLIDEVPMTRINAALLLSQPAHLQRLHGRSMTSDERDEKRAALMRRIVTGS